VILNLFCLYVCFVNRLTSDFCSLECLFLVCFSCFTVYDAIRCVYVCVCVCVFSTIVTFQPINRFS
jgi:hypothetical protein